MSFWITAASGLHSPVSLCLFPPGWPTSFCVARSKLEVCSLWLPYCATAGCVLYCFCFLSKKMYYFLFHSSCRTILMTIMLHPTAHMPHSWVVPSTAAVIGWWYPLSSCWACCCHFMAHKPYNSINCFISKEKFLSASSKGHPLWIISSSLRF